MRLVRWLVSFMSYCPILVFTGVVLTLTKKYFFVACLCLTALVLITQIWLTPLLCASCTERDIVFPDDLAELKREIMDLCFK